MRLIKILLKLFLIELILFDKELTVPLDFERLLSLENSWMMLTTLSFKLLRSRDSWLWIKRNRRL